MFDYIIVGAGSAGCILANRLSQNPSNKVLLLEAGPKDFNPMIHMPGGCAEVLKSNALNWKFESTPQEHVGNHIYDVPRGKTLGGSSSANGMVYIRGHASDYDEWEAAGNKGWAYLDVLKHFKSFENFCHGENDYHGQGGELNVIEAPGDNPLFDVFLNASAEAGYKTNDDFNGADQEGVGRFHATIKDAKRWSSATAFLTPALSRPNLTVITGALVSKVILEGDKAVGIEYFKGKKSKQVKASKEIILSAGTIKSPHILQLSGIGDEQDLKAAGIETKKHLVGVGKGLQDHLDWIVRYAINEPLGLNGQDRFPYNVKIAWDYFVHKKGIAACNNIEAGGFIKTRETLDRPDVQLHFVPCNMTGLTDKLPAQHGITLHACCLRPASSGSIKPADNNPASNPLIDFGFMSNKNDSQVMLDAIRVLRNIAKQPAFKSLIGEEITPGKQYQTDEELLLCLNDNTETVYHPTSSCRMGNDELAVVDERLRVHGISNLRIADASIMPSIIGGNTNAPAMMIGDKCAAMVLDDNA